MRTSAKISICGLAVLTLLSGCVGGRHRGGTYSRVSLQERIVRPGPSAPQSIEGPYRIGVASISSPCRAAETYGPIVSYLSAEMRHPAQLVLAQSYAELNKMVGSGNLIAAFVCSGGYVDGQSECGLELIAAPEYKGHATYSCYIVAPTGSKAKGLSDFRGKRFAFTDRDSNTGCVIPTYQIMKMGERPDSFFEEIIYTRSHDKAISAVRSGIVDGAAVHNLVYELAAHQDPRVKEETRVIFSYGPYASPPVVVNRNTPEQFKAALRRVLLNMHKDAQGRKLLDAVPADRFVPVTDSDYHSIRTMRKEMTAWTNQSRGRAQ